MSDDTSTEPLTHLDRVVDWSRVRVRVGVSGCENRNVVRHTEDSFFEKEDRRGIVSTYEVVQFLAWIWDD